MSGTGRGGFDGRVQSARSLVEAQVGTVGARRPNAFCSASRVCLVQAEAFLVPAAGEAGRFGAGLEGGGAPGPLREPHRRPWEAGRGHPKLARAVLN